MNDAAVPDGFNTTIVLDCGCTSRLNLSDDDARWFPGCWDSCYRHSKVYDYDAATGDPNYERDRRVVEVRKELSIARIA